jgi:hypothetical protein
VIYSRDQNRGRANVGVGLTTSSENQNDPENEVLDIARREFNNKSLNEIFTLSGQLYVKVLEFDPNMERSIKFKRELDHLLAPYKEIHKNLKRKRNIHQKIFRLFKHQTVATNGMLK